MDTMLIGPTSPTPQVAPVGSYMGPLGHPSLISPLPAPVGSYIGLLGWPPLISPLPAHRSAEGVKPGPGNRMVVLSARAKERKLSEGLRSTLYKVPDLSVLQVAEA
ncbi:unnamed protein product [Leuciscus chuanchicus]